MTYGVTEIVASPTPVSATGSGIAAIEPQALSLTDSEGWAKIFGTGTSNNLAGVKVNHLSVMGYPPMWRGINLLANSVSCLPMDVYRNPSREIATNHPAQRLLKHRANPIQSATNFRKTAMGHMLLFGNAFAVIERSPTNEPVAMWHLDPQSVVVRFFEGELWYMTTLNGQQMTFAGRNVAHYKGLSHNGITGYSALDLFQTALGLPLAAVQFGARFFGDGANTSGILMVPGHWDPAKIRNTLSDWKDMSQGMSNAHKVALLQDGVKFQPMSIEPNKAQFLETREHEVRATVSNIIGVPGHLLGDNSKSSFNSLEQENQSYLIHSLDPHLTEIENENEHKLLTEQEQMTERVYVETNREASIQMLMKDKIDAIYRQMELGILTANEGRALLNLKAIGADGDVRYRPANWMPIDTSTDDDSTIDTETITAPEEDQETRVAAIVQKVYPGVGQVLTADEARRLVTEAGFDLPPGFEPDAPAPAFGAPADDSDAQSDEDAGDDEPDDEDDTLLAMIRASVADALEQEKTKIVTAALRTRNFEHFCDRISKFYEAWQLKLLPSLGDKIDDVRTAHVDRRLKAITEVASSSTDRSLRDDIKCLVEDWGDDCDALTDQLYERART